MASLKFIEPMYARAVEKLPEGREWLYEVKLDGYRCLARRDSKGVILWSRRANIFTTQFPRIARACEKLQPDTLIASFFNRSCYERDNGHKTHRAKRSCLFQAHYKDDDNLEGIRKREQEAIWQSTFSFPPDPHLATNTYGSFSFPYSLARRSISSFTFISWVAANSLASASIFLPTGSLTPFRIPTPLGWRFSHPWATSVNPNFNVVFCAQTLHQ